MLSQDVCLLLPLLDYVLKGEADWNVISSRPNAYRTLLFSDHSLPPHAQATCSAGIWW